MSTPVTPEQWLPVLAKRLQDRRPTTAKLRSYVDGNAPLPEMGKNLRASWVAFQKKARTNFGGLAVDTVTSRIVPLGVLVGDAAGDDAKATAERIWRDNRMRTQIDNAVRDAESCRIGYLLVSTARDGTAVVSRRKPEDFIAAPDPLQPWKARAYLSTWEDADHNAQFAYVGADGAGQLFARPLSDDKGDAITYASLTDAWAPVGDADTWNGRPKVTILDRADGQALIEPHLDLIDRINHGKLNRLVITAMQAFRQRALKTKEGQALPDADRDGNAINWAKAFEPSPGALWELPGEIEDIWESQQVDIRPLLEGEQNDAREFAAVTRLPVAVFTPEGANQSATGASVAVDGLYSQAEAEIAYFEPGVSLAMVYALEVERVDLKGATVQVRFAPPDRVTMAERYSAAVQAKAAGISRKTILQDVLGMSPEQIRTEETNAAADQLAALALSFSAGGNGTDAATA